MTGMKNLFSGVDAPLVSIVIPTRHRIALLNRAVQSVDAQAYDPIQVVIVDNCSDEPIRPADIQTRHSCLIVRTDSMLPASRARHFGVQKAQGELICFLDDDDVYKENKIRDEVDYLRDHPQAEFVYGQTVHVGPDGAILVVSRGEPEISSFLRWRYVHLNSLMVRQSVYQQEPFNFKMTTFEDVEFVGRLIRRGHGAYIPDIHSVWYRDGRPDQLTRRNWRRSYVNWKILCAEFRPEILRDKGLTSFYHKKMLILSLMFFDFKQTFVSALALINTILMRRG